MGICVATNDEMIEQQICKGGGSRIAIMSVYMDQLVAKCCNFKFVLQYLRSVGFSGHVSAVHFAPGAS
jgi:hypothetical protein